MLFAKKIFECPGSKVPLWRNWKIAKMALLDPGMKFEFFWPKAFFWSIMKIGIRKNILNLSQGLPNPGFIQEKVQKANFLKKDWRELLFFSWFRFLWISWRPGKLNWEQVVFLPSKNLYRKCVLKMPQPSNERLMIRILTLSSTTSL